MSPQKKRGTLICLEGLDRAGKTTQCDLLLQRLSSLSLPHRLQKFPDRATPTGSIINTYLTAPATNPSSSDPSPAPAALEDHAIHLLFSSNRWEAVPALLASLKKGETVVMDRYLYSGIAFSAAKGLDYNWCKNCDVGLPKPDATIFLDLSEDAAEKRGGYGGERYEKRSFQRIVRGLFNRLREEENIKAQRRNDDGEEGSATWAEEEDMNGRWWVIDASQSVEDVAAEVWGAVEQGMKFAEESEVGVWSG